MVTQEVLGTAPINELPLTAGGWNGGFQPEGATREGFQLDGLNRDSFAPQQDEFLYAQGGKDGIDNDTTATNDNEFEFHDGIRVNRHEQRKTNAAFAEIVSHLGELASL